MEESRKTKKPKVLIVHNAYQIPGGEDVVVANEKKLLEDHGHEVILYCRRNDELRNMKIVRKLLLPFMTVYNPGTAKDIRRIIKEQGVDIVHVHNVLNLISPSVYYAACRCHVPVVQTVHNFRLLCPGATFYRDGHICEDCVERGLWCAVRHRCYRGSVIQTLLCVISTLIHRRTGIYERLHYICLTTFNKEKLLLLNRERKIIGPDRVFIKPNFTFEESRNSSWRKEKTYFLFIGRIEEIKGVGLLVEAFRRMPDRELRLAGTGKDLEYYRSKATANVSFLGLLDRQQLLDQLSGAKAVIVPSQWYETFGMVIIEAYAAHCPVIAGNIGNIGDLVEDGKTGVTFQYNSPEALIKALETVSGSMGEEGYRRYLEKYCPETNYQQLAEIYDALIGNRD